VNTQNYQGKITKTAKVHSNDPARQVEILRITAFVKVPIYISTRYVYLVGQAGQTTTRSVKIRAELDKPLKLEPAHFDLSSKVIFRMEEVEPGKTFLIHFTNIPGTEKIYYGFLKLRTNYPEKPEISIRIRGKFGAQKPPVSSKTPPQKSQK
jgi:hypothetical protein